MWIVGRCILCTGIKLLLLIRLFNSAFFFPSNYQTLKFFVTFFSGTVRSRRSQLGTHMDSGQMYCVYRNQAAAAYLSLYLFIFLSLQFSNIKIFRHTYIRNSETSKVETWYTRGQWVDLWCIPKIRLLLLVCPFIFSFPPIFKH